MRVGHALAHSGCLHDSPCFQVPKLRSHVRLRRRMRGATARAHGLAYGLSEQEAMAARQRLQGLPKAQKIVFENHSATTEVWGPRGCSWLLLELRAAAL